MADPKGPDPTPSTAGKTVAGGGTRATISFTPLPAQDLTKDQLLMGLPRDAEGHPTVGGIPLLRKIGKGAMGAVYYAIHPRLHVEVAIKILPFHLAEQDAKIIDRFMSEGRMAASLESDHIVRVLDVNVDGETHYLVMQFIRGESAGALVRRTKEAGALGLTESDALKIVRASTKGLAAAHERGIIHRDVKPDNILIPNNNLDRTKLADLGLAKPEGGGGSVGTMSMVAMGTPGYMAPEQAEDAKTAGPAADVFAMGATLYALMMGKAPFAGSSIAIILRDTAMKDPEPLPASTSGRTRDIVAKCLAKNPLERFQNGTELLAALEGRLSEESYKPTVITAVRRKKEAEKRKAALPFIAAGAVALIAVIVVVAVLLTRGGEVKPPPPVNPPVDPTVKRKAVEKALGDAKAKAADGDYEAALASLKDVDTPEAKTLRDEYEPKAKEQRERRDRDEAVTRVLTNVATLEKTNDFDAALAAINSALGNYPDDQRLRDAKTRINAQISAIKGSEQREENFRRWRENAESASFNAQAKDTIDAWKPVLQACAKAGEYAKTDEEKAAIRDLLEPADQRTKWLTARDADEKGSLDQALELATAAAAVRKPPRELEDYLSALTARKRAADERLSRKKAFDRFTAEARAEKDPVKAADLWKLALAAADDPEDARTAQSTLQSLVPEIAKAEEDKRKAEMRRKAQLALDEAETALKASNFDLADAKFKEAQPVLPDEAAKGLARSSDARRQKQFDDAMAEARDLQSRKEWQKAKIAVDRALQAKPGDASAKTLLATIEPNLIPEKIEINVQGSVLTFVRVRASTFTMGDPEFDKEPWLKNAMPHEVTLTRDYWMMTTEMTQAVWEAVMGSNPSKNRGGTFPVESITWLDCASFIEKLNTKVADQIGRRKIYMPTEAEWECACRAGSKTAWSFGGDPAAIGEYAWIDANSGGTTHPVGQKKPNALGLYDMHGNVYEWCTDWYEPFSNAKLTDPAGPQTAKYKSSRGGCYSYIANYARSGFRGQPEPTEKRDALGLRILIK